MDLKPEKILGEVNRLSGGKLKFRDDLEKLIETAFANEKMNLLEKISFDAKFLSGLFGVIQKKNDAISPEYFEKTVSEYKDGIQGIKTRLNELVAVSSEFYKTVFTEKFLGMTQQSLQNLNLLCFDLSYLKLFFNDYKSAGKGEGLKF